MIDIVIPVYNAPQDLRSCVDSVISHTDSQHYRLTLINDGSTDPTIPQVLEDISKQAPAARLLANPSNLGFTATVNRAFQETTSDVLLLNSDTVVTPGWLRAMVRCLHSDHRIATVTPFSNNAEIASVPKWLEANPVPTAQVAHWYAQGCADTDTGHYPDLPTGVGFCMLIRRAALNAVGVFDEQTFGRGYGEENDWCQRALKAGWRNVLCTGAYVVHTGSQSFSESKAALVASNIVKLNQKHPQYDLDIQRFIARDPIAPYRLALRSRYNTLASARMPGVLHILHGKDGGLERHARDLIQLHPNARHYILLALGERWTIEDHTEAPALTFEIDHQRDELWRDFFDGVCERFKISVVHIHHVSANRQGLLLALKESKLPILVTLHDFYYQCPAVHLLRGDDSYCEGEVESSKCEECLNGRPELKGIDVAKWRSENEQLLSRADRVIAPSAFTARTTQRVFRELPIQVIPHHSVVQPTESLTAPVAHAQGSGVETVLTVVGAIGPLKGARIVEALARRIQQRGLPARVVVIGYLDRQFTPSERFSGRLAVHGAYRPAELPSLLARYGTSAVMFPAVGPETFGFVLSEVWACGYAPIVSNVGTLADRVRESGAGWVLDVPTAQPDSIDIWLDRVLEIAHLPTDEHRARAARGARALEAETEASSRLDYTSHKASVDLIPPRPLDARRWIPGDNATGTSNLTEIRTGTAYGLAMRSMRPIFAFMLRLRYTVFGRVVERRLSPSVKRRIRTTLLGR